MGASQVPMRPDFERWLMNIHRAGLCRRVVAIFQGQDRVEVECEFHGADQ